MRVGVVLLIALALLAASAYALYYTNYTAYFMWSPTYTCLLYTSPSPRD